MKRFVASLLAVCSACVCVAAQPPKGLLTAPLMGVEEIHATNLKLDTAEDGTRYIAMRLHLDGAAAVRLYISGMQLAVGQKLLVSNVSGTQVYGPFEVAGPTQSGEFWTEAVEGSDVIVELQTGPDGAADLPFKIEAIEAAELADIMPAAQTPYRETVDSLYRGIPVTHEIVNGIAVYEGDILLGPANELPRAHAGTKDRVRSAVGITGKSYRWPNATIPYVISATLPSPARVTEAIAHWNLVMAGTVRMVPRTTETPYISFNRAASAGTCTSYIGKTFSGAQPIDIGDSCSKGNAIHEIGHAWGLWHEHTREDRNNYVVVNLDNVQTGQTHNFTQNIATGDDIGAYDFNSIMHYNTVAFSKNGLPTIMTIPAGINIGQRSALSTGDIAGIKALYPPPATVTPVTISTTITANPDGASISADGVTYATPVSFNWIAGSVHTIAAVNSSSSTMRTTFAKWSDNGTQSHTVAASTAVTTFKVDYAVAYSVKATAVPAGSAVASPVSADTFYVNGSSVALNATAPSGYCFTGWAGLIAGTPTQTSVVANRSYDVQANFQTGTITLTVSTLPAAAAGGTYSTGVTANSGCLWTAASTVPWIKVSSVTSGSGSGTISFTVDPNSTGLQRSGTISVEGRVLSVSQPAVDSMLVAPQVTSSGAAAFIGLDTTTAGSWKGIYGADGYQVISDASSYPSYVTVTPSGYQSFVWSASTTDPRGLQKSSSTAADRMAACWYSATAFNIGLAFNDQNTHQVAIYMADWDRLYNRTQKIEVVDANNTVLDSRTVATFAGGQYLVWNLSGRVTIRITNTNPKNAVISGIFFGGAPAPAKLASDAASFIGTDTTTGGSWKGVYGTEGFNVLNEAASYPSYVTVTPSGHQSFVWSASTTDPRGLQKSSSTASDRIAACWYSATAFSIGLTFNDQNTHQVAIYIVDWDRLYNRTQKIEVVDANNTVLDSRTVATFAGGQYLAWNLRGRVTIRITNTNPKNAVVSGIFIR